MVEFVKGYGAPVEVLVRTGVVLVTNVTKPDVVETGTLEMTASVEATGATT